MHGHPHLATAAEHVDGAVVVAAEERAVGRRRLGQLVDLVPQGGDVVAGLPQRVGQLLVLRHGLGQLALRLEEALLERAHALGRVLEAAPEGDDLVLEGGCGVAQLGQLGLLGCVSVGLAGLVDGNHPLQTASDRTLHRATPDTTASGAGRGPGAAAEDFTGVRRVIHPTATLGASPDGPDSAPHTRGSSAWV